MKKHVLASLFICIAAFAADLTSPKIALPLNEGDFQAMPKFAKLANTQLMSWVEGPGGKALYLDNKLNEPKHAIITIPLPAEIKECKPFSISLQVKTPANIKKNRQYEILRVSNGKKPGLRLAMTWGSFRTDISEDGINIKSFSTATGTFPQVEANKWYHLGLVFDGKNINFYRDGVLFYSKEAAYKVSPKATVLNLFATSSAGACYYYEGAVTNFKYYAEALTAEEMAKLATMQ
ncbi:MAG: LamG domain-containing protein [Victivallales bacterium]|nr:LamG domain-containing protein [Victivallales bacterium]